MFLAHIPCIERGVKKVEVCICLYGLHMTVPID